METQKPLEFKGDALGYFILFVVSLVMTYIPLFGWAFLLNFSASWFADNTLVNGKKVVYKAGYVESLKFITINALLLLVTFGIYVFWFTPKSYRYIVDHVQYLDEATVSAPAAMESKPPVEPVAPAGS